MESFRMCCVGACFLWMTVFEVAYGDVYVVTTTADTGTGSLRQAIEMTLTPGPDSIRFAIPTIDPGYNASQGTWIIRPNTALPIFLSDQTVVDGTSQAKFTGGDPNPDGPEIEISGDRLGPFAILAIWTSRVEIRGLTLNHASYCAVKFHEAHGGGLFGCYIGATSNGDGATDNWTGVLVTNMCRDVVIGGSEDPGDGNLIAGNAFGIAVEKSSVNISIIGNRIGTNRSGTGTMPGQIVGISVADTCDSIKVFDNLIGGQQTGIDLSRCAYSEIGNNFIGTDETWTQSLGNTAFGISLQNRSRDNRIADNFVANSGSVGIWISGEGSLHNRLVRNLMAKNGQKGIMLVNGGNGGLSSPAIVSVTPTAVSGTAGPGNDVEIFADDASEGRYFRGSAHADPRGAFVLPLSIPITTLHVTATATDAAGNTSEFSVPCSSTTTAALMVTTTADTGTGSLRWAIAMAQAPGPDTIRFAIPLSDPGYTPSKGTWTITPLSTLWAFTDSGTVVDGKSQAKIIGGDPNPFGPEIEINSQNLTAGPVFAVLAPNVEIRGLTVNRARLAAILFQGVRGGGVYGCYLGTTSDGMATAGNQYGVWILDGSRDIVVGGSNDSGEGNLISGNDFGIYVQTSCVNVAIIGNRIGTNRTGTDTIGNKYAGIGAYNLSDSMKVADNLIGGSRRGIDLEECAYSVVANNFIGTDDGWTHNLGNREYGVYLENSHDIRLADNSIGNNKQYGVFIAGNNGIHNLLTRNMISKNGQEGISLAAGGNLELTPPSIISVTAIAVSGMAGPGNVVEVFADDSSQGRYYKGTAIADGGGTFVLSLPSPITRRNATATATDSLGNTSGFSVPFQIGTVDVRSMDQTPTGFSLHQNYPNPFNPATTIEYTIAGSGHEALGTRWAKLAVYDMLGRVVAMLVNEPRAPGEYHVRFDGTGLGSGVYLCRLSAGGYVETKRMLLIR